MFEISPDEIEIIFSGSDPEFRIGDPEFRIRARRRTFTFSRAPKHRGASHSTPHSHRALLAVTEEQEEGRRQRRPRFRLRSTGGNRPRAARLTAAALPAPGYWGGSILVLAPLSRRPPSVAGEERTGATGSIVLNFSVHFAPERRCAYKWDLDGRMRKVIVHATIQFLSNGSKELSRKVYRGFALAQTSEAITD